MECEGILSQQYETNKGNEEIDNKVSFLITMASVLEEEGGTPEDKLLLAKALIQQWVLEQNIDQERKNFCF